MRKLLFDTEREEARVAAEEHMRHQRMIMGGMNPEFMAAMQNMPPAMMGPGGTPMFNPAFMGMPPPQNMKMPNGAPASGPEAYAQMFSFMQQQQQQMGMPPFPMPPQQQQQGM